LTKDEIRDMQAGPEMDKIVAVKVTDTGMFRSDGYGHVQHTAQILY